METLKIPSALPELGVRASRSSPSIIATDGSEQADSALVVGRMFAEGTDALRVVTVLKPMPMIPEAQMPATAELDASRRAEAQREATTQMVRTWDDEHDLEVYDGDPATVITRLAH